MSTKKLTAESRFEFTQAEADAIKITESQCKDCKYEFGFDGCKILVKHQINMLINQQTYSAQ